MLRRWIIRSFFMVPILLCLGAWGWSRSHSMWIEYCHHDRYISCGSFWGTVGVMWGTDTVEPDGWTGDATQTSNAHFWPFRHTPGFFLGFVYFHGRTSTQTFTLLHAPLWFLIIVFSSILYVVWRKTRPRGAGRAFPVELTAPRSEPDDKTK